MAIRADDHCKPAKKSLPTSINRKDHGSSVRRTTMISILKRAAGARLALPVPIGTTGIDHGLAGPLVEPASGFSSLEPWPAVGGATLLRTTCRAPARR